MKSLYESGLVVKWRFIRHQPGVARSVGSVPLCQREGCDRVACTASDEGYTEYCCPGCARSGQHTALCNSYWPDVESRLRTSPDPGDKLTPWNTNKYATVLDASPDGSFRVQFWDEFKSIRVAHVHPNGGFLVVDETIPVLVSSPPSNALGQLAEFFELGGKLPEPERACIHALTRKVTVSDDQITEIIDTLPEPLHSFIESRGHLSIKNPGQQLYALLRDLRDRYEERGEYAVKL